MVAFAPIYETVEEQRVSGPASLQPADLPTKVAILEASMGTAHANIGKLDDDHATHLTRTGEAESKLVELGTWIRVGGSVATLIVLSSIGYLTTQVNSIQKDVTRLQQIDRDRGVEIVKQIANPIDPTQFHEAVATATTSLQEAAQIKKVPDLIKVASLSDALTKATSKGDVSADTWQLASEFVSYRSDAKAGFAPSSLPACSSLKLDKSASSNSLDKAPTLTANHCVLNLSEVDSLTGPHLRDLMQNGVPNLLLTGVELKYRDSSDRADTPAFRALTCNSCRYDFESKESPPPEIKEIIKTLVMADTKKLVIKPQS